MSEYVYMERRIVVLEQLCRDMYEAAIKYTVCSAPDPDGSGNCINPEQDCLKCKWYTPVFQERMEDLGLLEGE